MFEHLVFPSESLSAQTMDFDLISWSLDPDTPTTAERSSNNMDIFSYDTEVKNGESVEIEWANFGRKQKRRKLFEFENTKKKIIK